MLCQACDAITLKALHSKYGYEHGPSFHFLKASAEAELCSLCRLLWSAVQEMDRQTPNENSLMQYPVRLCLDGMLRSFSEKKEKRILSSESFTTSSAFHIRQLRASKTPASMLVCALEPDTLAKGGFRNSVQGRVSLYREPSNHLLLPSVLLKPSLTLFTDMDRFWGNPYGGRPVSSHANSVECFDLAMHWIQFCLTDHDDCRRVVCPNEWVGEWPHELGNEWGRYSSSDESDVSELSDQYPPEGTELIPGSDSPNSQDSALLSRHSPSPQNTQSSDMSRGLLNRLIPVTRPSKKLPPGGEFGYWKLYLRSHSLKELEQDGSDLLRECSVPLLPTRYICVDNNPRLCIATPGSRGFYVALSYCWGLSKPLATTVENLHSHLRAIDMPSMPQTLRDAIMITRELGLEYLWVDSLCILQDSQEDWQRESSKMRDVYGNAFLTISAAASADTTQGIFVPRSVPPIPPVEIRPRDSKGTCLYAAKFLDNIPLETRQLVDNRAWCFQEIALSPRVLVYGAEMLGWLCDSVTDVEHGGSFSHEEDPSPPLLAPRIHQKLRTKPVKHGAAALEFLQFLDDQENQVGLWPSVINEYTKRRLTRESDRLPALSGIVKEIHLETGDEYLSGLWKNDLRYGLSWKVDVLFSTEDAEWKRPSKYRAPSWSWASIEGPVIMDLKGGRKIQNEEKYGSTDNPQTFRLLEAATDVTGLDPFGEVSGGYLQLSARLREVTICARNWKIDGSDPLWRVKRLQERYFDVLDIHGAWIGRCCMDMPTELGSTRTLWWLSLDVYGGILIQKGIREGQFSRVGQVWCANDYHIWWEEPEDLYEDVTLV
jgi:Heterokaryon incompatibility protein (HET)